MKDLIDDREKYFSDYEAFTDNEISGITERGITLKNGMHIDFARCADVWAELNSAENTKCVGERDITD